MPKRQAESTTTTVPPSSPPAATKRKRIYETTWRNKWLTAHAESLDEMIQALRDAATRLEQMRNDGVEADFGSAPDDYISLSTTNAALAQKYGLDELSHDEEESEEQ